MEKPHPETFALASYVLAIVSSAIIALSLVASFLPDSIAAVAQQVCWLAMFTSGIGTFMAYAARIDLGRQSLPPALARKLTIGWRFNLLIVVLMVVLALVQIIGRLTGRAI